MSSPPIILYGYVGSPFTKKLEQLLILKQLPYSLVTVSHIMPRPALDLIGVTYRKIPVLAIGNEVYLDSYLAASALERKFPENTIFTRESEGLQRIVSFFWTDRVLFPLVAVLFDWTKAGPEFAVDRAKMIGAPAIDPKMFEALAPGALGSLRSNLDFVELQLAARTSPENFLLNTTTPNFADLSVYFILDWLKSLPLAQPLFTGPVAKHPLVDAYYSLFSAYLAKLPKVEITSLSGEEGSKLIHEYQPTQVSSFATDEHEPALGESLKLGDIVEVTPNDVGKVPQVGVLIAIDSQVVTLEVEVKDAAAGKTCRVLAPRLGFTVTRKA